MPTYVIKHRNRSLEMFLPCRLLMDKIVPRFSLLFSLIERMNLSFDALKESVFELYKILASAKLHINLGIREVETIDAESIFRNVDICYLK